MEYQSSTSRHTWAAFATYENAADAVAAFLDHGVPKEQVNLITTNVPSPYLTTPNIVDQTEADKAAHHAREGLTPTTGADAGVGAAKGLAWGIGVGVLAGISALAVPGFGLVIGGGALATAIAGAVGTTAGGAIAGAVTGYLHDQGADESYVGPIVERIQRGDVVININMDADRMSYEEEAAIINKYGGNMIPVAVASR
jgi:hypothetical protein